MTEQLFDFSFLQAFIPSLYMFGVYFFVSHPPLLDFQCSTIVIVLGMLSIYLNYSVDKQKQDFKAARGDCMIWGKKNVPIYS